VKEPKLFTAQSQREGVGLLIIESPTIDYPEGARWRERYRMDADKYIKGMSELVDESINTAALHSCRCGMTARGRTRFSLITKLHIPGLR